MVHPYLDFESRLVRAKVHRTEFCGFSKVSDVVGEPWESGLNVTIAKRPLPVLWNRKPDVNGEKPSDMGKVYSMSVGHNLGAALGLLAPFFSSQLE